MGRSNDLRSRGRVEIWNEERGFGFIVPADGGGRVFLHIKVFADRDRRPVVGDVVTYRRVMDSKGKPCALEARIEGVEVKRRVKREGVGFEYGLVVIFAFVLGGAVWWRRLPEVMVHVYWVLSTVCFAMYALDKKAAQTGLWRIPEARLHFIALLGGWPGALVAQAMFRHKTRKRSFRFGFWLTVLANCGFVGWLMSSEGAAMRRAIDRGWRALLAWVGR